MFATPGIAPRFGYKLTRDAAQQIVGAATRAFDAGRVAVGDLPHLVEGCKQGHRQRRVFPVRLGNEFDLLDGVVCVARHLLHHARLFLDRARGLLRLSPHAVGRG